MPTISKLRERDLGLNAVTDDFLNEDADRDYVPTGSATIPGGRIGSGKKRRPAFAPAIEADCVNNDPEAVVENSIRQKRCDAAMRKLGLLTDEERAMFEQFGFVVDGFWNHGTLFVKQKAVAKVGTAAASRERELYHEWIFDQFRKMAADISVAPICAQF